MHSLHPQVVVRRDVVNQSDRVPAGAAPRLIVIHDTESHNRPGAGDLAAIGEWFDNPAAQASAHVCVDADGTSARFVADGRKAWHVAAYNSVALGIEQIGVAAQPRTSWGREELRETARWVARWSLLYGIPIRRLTSLGVCRHSDLGAAGGGHHDPGPNYPIGRLLRYSRWYALRLRLQRH